LSKSKKKQKKQEEEKRQREADEREFERQQQQQKLIQEEQQRLYLAAEAQKKQEREEQKILKLKKQREQRELAEQKARELAAQPPAVSPWQQSEPPVKATNQGSSMRDILAQEEKQKNKVQLELTQTVLKHSQEQEQLNQHQPHTSNQQQANGGPAWGNKWTPPAVVAKVKPDKKKNKLSFLEIQKAEEKAKEAARSLNEKMGVPVANSMWTAAVGAKPQTSGFATTVKQPSSSGAWGGGTQEQPQHLSVQQNQNQQPQQQPQQQQQQQQQRAPQQQPTPSAYVPKPVVTQLPPSKPPQQSRAKPTHTTNSSSHSKDSVADGFWDLDEPQSKNKKNDYSTSNKRSDGDAEARFVKWCQDELKNCQEEKKSGDKPIDIEVFVSFIRDEYDEQLVLQYIQEYFGDSGRVRSFLKQFVDQRSKLNSSQSGWETASRTVSAPQMHSSVLDGEDEDGDDQSDGFASVGKGGKKKKKSRGQRLDPAMLNFNVASSGGANRGQIDTGAWQKR